MPHRRFEYKYFAGRFAPEFERLQTLDDELATLGDKGWELVAVLKGEADNVYICFLKREIDQSDC